MRAFLTCFLCVAAYCSHAQTFTNVAFDEGIVVQVQGAYVGCGASLYDFNGDGLDDITLCSPGNNIHLYQNFGDYFAPTPFTVTNTDEAKMALWGDYDNDGDADLLVTKAFAQTRLYRNDGDLTFTDVTTTCGMPLNPEMRSYGAAWGDYDRDGLLDLYICNYNFNGDITNYLLHNEGGDSFTQVQEELGVTNEVRPGFQPAFNDFNHDLWPDIYVINDKVHPNVMYANNGDGSFSDVSIETGSQLIVDAMSNSWSDFDHDGDHDVYVSNATAGNKFLVNQENAFFVESAEQHGLEVFSICWGALWIDYNNDSWDDLHVTTTINGFAGNQNFFFENQAGVFTENLEASGIINDVHSSYSSARGDINNDGYPDMLISTEAPDYVTLWENSGGENNWAKVTLQGVASNRDGIGSWVSWFTHDSEKQFYTQSGDNYMGQSSQHHILGLGTAESVDSVSVAWPSGWVDTWHNLAQGMDHLLVEGSSFSATIEATLPVSFCAGDSALLVLPEGDWTWNTGALNDSLWVFDTGAYSATLNDNSGLTFWSDTLNISVNPLPEPSWDIMEASCFGASNAAVFFISSDPGYFLMDSDSTTTTGLGPGTYNYQLSSFEGCTVVVNVTVTEPELLEVNLTGIVSGDGLSANLEAEAFGGTPPYTYYWLDGSIGPETTATSPGYHSCLIQDDHGCFASGGWTWQAETAIEESNWSAFLGPNPSTGTLTYVGPPAEILMYNTQGQLISKKQCANHEVLYVHDLPKGFYLVRVLTSAGTSTVRLLLE